MRMLIVEDDPALGLFLRKGMAALGHETFWVGDGAAVLKFVQSQRPDLVILDLGLPNRDGVEVLHELRQWSDDSAVVVLTGRNDLDERVRCLDLGADDCLLKPFSFKELTARCNAVLRRRKDAIRSTLSHGPIEIDLLTRKVWRNGQPVELTVKEFSLLEYLVRRPAECCSREELLRDLWQVKAEAATNVVDVYINYLRKKLAAAAEDGTGEPLIETVRGSGYRLARASKAEGWERRSVAA